MVNKGSSNYAVSDELRNAVNIAIALQKPLLIKGEPGTGKTCWPRALPKDWAEANHLEHQVQPSSGRTL